MTMKRKNKEEGEEKESNDDDMVRVKRLTVIII